MRRFTHGNPLFLFLCLTAMLIILAGCSEADHNKTGSGLRFSHESGVYRRGTLTVTVKAPKGCTVAYTTDGSVPTAENDSGRSTVRVKLTGGMTEYLIEHADLQDMKDFEGLRLRDDPSLPCGVMLCAAPVDASGRAGVPESEVYFLGLDFDELFPNCLVLFVITDPENLLDYDRGILAAGSVYDAWRQTEEGRAVVSDGKWWEAETNSTQRGRMWERPCQVQLYDGETRPVVEQIAGIRVQGNISRRMAQKSFNLYFRADYGAKTMAYELFPGNAYYKNFTLRGGGNNTNGMKFKNAMLQDLVSDRAVTVEASRPAVLFLNGEYWGPYLLTEKLSAEMLHGRYGVQKEQVIIIKDGELEEGNEEDMPLYGELLSFAGQDLSRPEVYKRFCSVVDVKSFADSCAIRIYIGDADWSTEYNEVLWRTRDPSYREGRWQYLLHDIEFSSGLYGYSGTAAETDHYERAIQEHGLFAAAIQNDDFRALFRDALMQIGAENYDYERVLEVIQIYGAVWRPLMVDYSKRFGTSLQEYDNGVKETLFFFAKRYDCIVPKIQGR